MSFQLVKVLLKFFFYIVWSCLIIFLVMAPHPYFLLGDKFLIQKIRKDYTEHVLVSMKCAALAQSCFSSKTLFKNVDSFPLYHVSRSAMNISLFRFKCSVSILFLSSCMLIFFCRNVSILSTFYYYPPNSYLSWWRLDNDAKLHRRLRL